MHVQDEKKLAMNTIGRTCNYRGHPGTFRVENGNKVDSNRNLTLQQATYGPFKQLLQELLT